MIGLIILLLLAFWFLGYIKIPGLYIPNIIIFSFNGHPVTLWGILILFVIASLIGILPSPFRQIAGVVLILWILSIFGIITIVGFPHIIVWAVIIGLLAYLLGLA